MFNHYVKQLSLKKYDILKRSEHFRFDLLSLYTLFFLKLFETDNFDLIAIGVCDEVVHLWLTGQT